MPNPIVYFEITGDDKAVLEDFYRAVFDWQLTPANDQYTHVAPGGALNGGIGKSMTGPGYVTVYVEVASIEETFSTVEGRGGRRLMEPQQMPNGPLIAMFADPEGRPVGIIQANTMRTGSDK